MRVRPMSEGRHADFSSYNSEAAGTTTEQRGRCQSHGEFHSYPLAAPDDFGHAAVLGSFRVFGPVRQRTRSGRVSQGPFVRSFGSTSWGFVNDANPNFTMENGPDFPASPEGNTRNHKAQTPRQNGKTDTMFEALP